jgi:hypothetical protein
MAIKYLTFNQPSNFKIIFLIYSNNPKSGNNKIPLILATFDE